MSLVATINFASVEADFPGCQVEGVAEYYTPKQRWTQLYEGEQLAIPERSLQNQILLAMLAGATRISLRLKELTTGRTFQECYSLRDIVN